MASYPLDLKWFKTIDKSLSQIMDYYLKFSVRLHVDHFTTFWLSDCSISSCDVLYFVGHHATGQ